MVITFRKNLLFKNRRSYDLETGHTASGSQALQSLYINGDLGLTLTDITTRSNLVAFAFEWEKLLQSN